MSLIDPPNIFNGQGPAILQWMNKAYVLLFSVQESGLSADRPTKNLWPGRQYYATDLGYPIYFHSLPNVWHNSAGGVV